MFGSIAGINISLSLKTLCACLMLSTSQFTALEINKTYPNIDKMPTIFQSISDSNTTLNLTDIVDVEDQNKITLFYEFESSYKKYTLGRSFLYEDQDKCILIMCFEGFSHHVGIDRMQFDGWHVLSTISIGPDSVLDIGYTDAINARLQSILHSIQIALFAFFNELSPHKEHKIIVVGHSLGVSTAAKFCIWYAQNYNSSNIELFIACGNPTYFSNSFVQYFNFYYGSKTLFLYLKNDFSTTLASPFGSVNLILDIICGEGSYPGISILLSNKKNKILSSGNYYTKTKNFIKDRLSEHRAHSYYAAMQDLPSVCKENELGDLLYIQKIWTPVFNSSYSAYKDEYHKDKYNSIYDGHEKLFSILYDTEELETKLDDDN